MGWASGSDLAEEIWKIVGKHIPEKKHQKVAEKLLKAFENMDCDTMQEVSGPIGDAANRGYFHRWHNTPLRPEEGATCEGDGEHWVFDGSQWRMRS